MLNHAGVISGAIAPPAGYEAAWAIRNLDVPQYLTWMNALRAPSNGLVLPDEHAPWQTGPGLLEPLFWIAAWIPLPALGAYYVLHFALYWIACFVLLYAASVFCPGRQTIFALAIAACAVPIRLFGWMFASLFGSIKWQALFAAGLIDYGYDSADGLFRGGLSNSPTLTSGTIFVLLAMTLLARYTQTWARKFWIALCALTAISAAMHPFEVFLIVAACAAPLLLQRRFFDWLGVGIAGFLGLIPYLVLGIRSEWLRDAGDISPSSFHPLTIAADFGLPCILVVYFLMLRFRMPDPRDTVLRSWFFALPVLFVLPGVPFPLHLMNGFAYCIGFLLVRRLACDKQIMPLIHRHRRGAAAVFGTLATFAAAALSIFYIQVSRDGRNPDPLWLLSSLERVEQPALIDWVRTHSPSDALIFAPTDIAPWLATIPRHTLASHDLFSITYPQQQQQVDRVLKAELPLETVVSEYGVRIAILPAVSKAQVSQVNWRADIGPWKIYEFPGESMKPYPGLAALDPSIHRSLRARVLGWIAQRK